MLMASGTANMTCDLGLVMYKYTTSITAGMKDGNFCPPTAATYESPISLHRNTCTLASSWNYDFQEIECTAIVRQEPIESKMTTPLKRGTNTNP